MLAPQVPDGRLPPTLAPTSDHPPPNLTYTHVHVLCPGLAPEVLTSLWNSCSALARLLSLGPYTTEAQLFPLGADPHHEMPWILWGLWGH